MNAGKGSNKNNDGYVEADAALMQFDPLCLGAIGCTSGLVNPIEGARHVFNYALESKKMSK